MKRILLPFLFFAVVLSSCHHAAVQDDDYSNFYQEKFANPDNTFRTVPFYSLNDSLTAEEMDRQLELMKKAGMGGAFLHSRIGLLTPYLSDEWFEMMDAGLKSCQRLGMEAWFYDEDKWPSGFAGGIIPLQSKDFRSHVLSRKSLNTPLTDLDSLLYKDDRYQYVCHTAKMGSPWYNGTCWVDLMNPDMVKAFLECSYKPYIEKYAGKEMVFGMFTDEPQLYVGKNNDPDADFMISYSPAMEKPFKELWGYELDSVIPSLFEEVGNWRQIRLHYYRTVAYCMEQNYSKQMGDYCGKNGFIWTGHYNAEEFPSSTMRNEGNAMQQYRHMQMPGIDGLGLNFKQLHNDKVMTSVANQYGQQRRIIEIFGVSGHNLSFEDRMWIAAWHTHLGINKMCPHLSLYSMKGERKRDFPPTISYQQPYWSQNKVFEDFSARLCYFATCGHEQGEVCVITTLESEYIDADLAASDKTASARDEHFENILQIVSKQHYNFDIGDEQLISEIGSIDHNLFVIGKMQYRVVVVPTMLTIRPSTLNILCDFAKSGGKVIVVGDYPQYVEGQKDETAIAKLKKASTLVSEENLPKLLENSLNRDFVLQGNHLEKITTCLRTVGNGQILQLSNTSRTETLHIQFAWKHKNKRVALLNPINGECLQLEANNNGLYDIELVPAQTWILVNGDKSIVKKYDKKYALPGQRTPVMKLSNLWKGNRLNPNVLPLDFAEISVNEGKTWNEAEPLLAIYTRFQEIEENNIYNGPMMLRYKFYVEQCPQNCQLAVEQPEIYNQIQVNGNSLSFNGEDFYVDKTFKVTDIASFVKPGENEIILSLDFKNPIPKSLNAKERYGSEIETIYVIGDFAVSGDLAKEQPTETWRNRVPELAPKPFPTRFAYNSFKLVKEKNEFEGNLTNAGYPFFAGAFALTNHFKFAKKEEKTRYKLQFSEFESILLTVTLNGTTYPTLFCNPWEIDITDALKEGDNEIEIVLTNSLRNLMGPYHGVGGEFSAVGPRTFAGANGWPNFEEGDKDWYELRKSGTAKLWRDDYYCIPFGILNNIVISKEN